MMLGCKRFNQFKPFLFFSLFYLSCSHLENIIDHVIKAFLPFKFCSFHLSDFKKNC